MLNLVIVLIFTFVVAFVLIYFISAHDKKLTKQQNESLQKESTPDEQRKNFRLFTQFCVDLCEYLKLEVTDFSTESDFEILIKAENKNPITRVDYLILGLHLLPNENVSTTVVTSFSDQIISERLSKGILITTGLIPENIKNLPELASIDFIDGKKAKELKGKIIL